ncbi:M28 family peptidase [bacterium]|nr:M28 family peptidase [bacterium]
MATPRLSCLLLLLVAVGCRPRALPPLDPLQVDGHRAWEQVEHLVAFGPRPSGSPALGRAGDYVTARLQAAGWEVEDQVFHAPTPRGPIQFRNLVARAPGASRSGRPLILLGTHYDTKWLPEISFVGANDSGSGTAVLLEIARACGPQPDVWLVFLDGEECVRQYGPEDGLWGSRFFVADLIAAGRADRVRALILLDMVGDADLQVTMPGNSSGDLVALAFQAATSLGYRDRFHYRPAEILDDHVPFRQAGIPAVDLIDFEYGSGPGRNDYWHTTADTLEKMSPASLEIVGRTTVRMIELLRAGAGTGTADRRRR